MYQVRNNFRNNYKEEDILCPICKDSNDTQEHLFDCVTIKAALSDDSQQQSQYIDLFTNDTDNLINVAKKLKKIVATRDAILEESSWTTVEESSKQDVQ